MKATKEEFDLELLMYKDMMSFRKAYYTPENNEAYWTAIVDGAEQLHWKYNNNFMDQMLLVCADDIERRAGVNRKDRKEMLMKLVERLCRKDR